MEILTTEDFVIHYAQELKDFVVATMNHAKEKKKEFCKLFKCKSEEIDRLSASFFVERGEFVEHIRKISNGQTPPDWATGCFYNGEIQVLVDLKNPNVKMNTLAHETLHLFFEKTIYQNYNIERVNWLDESFAVYLDGNETDFDKEQDKAVEYLSKISKGFDLAVLSDYNKIKTKDYDGYDMFNLVGKYIFETKQEEKFLELLKTNRNEILEIGKYILQDAIDYFKGEK